MDSPMMIFLRNPSTVPGRDWVVFRTDEAGARQQAHCFGMTNSRSSLTFIVSELDGEALSLFLNWMEKRYLYGTPRETLRPLLHLCELR